MLRLSSPITAAGPSPIFTGFPFRSIVPVQKQANWVEIKACKNFTGGIGLICRGLNFSHNADIGQMGHLWMGTHYEHLDVIALKNTGIIFFVKPFPHQMIKYFRCILRSCDAAGRFMPPASHLSKNHPVALNHYWHRGSRGGRDHRIVIREHAIQIGPRPCITVAFQCTSTGACVMAAQRLNIIIV